jgi:hypothetical protein
VGGCGSGGSRGSGRGNGGTERITTAAGPVAPPEAGNSPEANKAYNAERIGGGPAAYMVRGYNGNAPRQGTRPTIGGGGGSPGAPISAIGVNFALQTTGGGDGRTANEIRG